MSLKDQIMYVVINTLTFPLALYTICSLSGFFGAMTVVLTYVLQIAISYFVFYKCFSKVRLQKDDSYSVTFIRTMLASAIWTIAVCFEYKYIILIDDIFVLLFMPIVNWHMYSERNIGYMLIYGVFFLAVSVILSHLICKDRKKGVSKNKGTGMLFQ